MSFSTQSNKFQISIQVYCIVQNLIDADANHTEKKLRLLDNFRLIKRQNRTQAQFRQFSKTDPFKLQIWQDFYALEFLHNLFVSNSSMMLLLYTVYSMQQLFMLELEIKLNNAKETFVMCIRKNQFRTSVGPQMWNRGSQGVRPSP